eukprot:4836175-Amphidinium_carterae.1
MWRSPWARKGLQRHAFTSGVAVQNASAIQNQKACFGSSGHQHYALEWCDALPLLSSRFVIPGFAFP